MQDPPGLDTICVGALYQHSYIFSIKDGHHAAPTALLERV